MDNWCIPCDGEADFEPSPKDLESMYQTLENGSILELSWKCQGRRLPSPPPDDTEIPESSDKEVASKNKEFDFMDEVSAPQIRVRSQNATPKGSAKKKTANFAGVIDAMKKHRLSQAPNDPKDSTL